MGGQKIRESLLIFLASHLYFFCTKKKKRNKKQIDWAGTRETKAKIKQLNEDFKNKKIKKIWTNYQEKSKFETLASTLKIDSIFGTGTCETASARNASRGLQVGVRVGVRVG